MTGVQTCALPICYIDADRCRQADALGVRGPVRKEHTVDDLGPVVRRAVGPPGSAFPLQ